MKHLFIINPLAGKKKDQERFRTSIHEIFRDRDYEIRVTEYAGHAEEIAREAAQSGEAVRIYACGGDGTLNEVVCGMAGYDNAAMTNVPTGTGNDFLKIFGPENKVAFCDLAALADGPQTAFDLMDCSGKLGLGVICTGVDARIAEDVHHFKRLPLVRGMGAYILSLIVNVIFKGISRPVTVHVDGETIDGKSSLICVCNGRYYGGGFMPVGEAMPDDGVLDILVVKGVSLPTLARLVGPYGKGQYRKFPKLIRHFHSTEITFTYPTESVTVVDGEVVRSTHFDVKLSDKKVNFFYPAYVSYQPESDKACAAAL